MVSQMVAFVISAFEKYCFLYLEVIGVLIIVIIALVRPSVGSRLFRKAECTFVHIARRRALAIVLVSTFVVIARAMLLPLLGIPEPFEDDEFSYLLAADTFASGRLTNQPHPMWQHFETYHVIMQPTYMSMYPPAQGGILAIGKVIGGHPWFGVWIAIGLMSAAICWMLQGWLPPGWALLGSFLVAMRFGVFSYWMNGYWGGAVAATGGALVLGALPRISRRWRLRDALLLGLGLGVLANSRPYEGFVLSVPVATILLIWIFVKRVVPVRLSLRNVLLPLLLFLILTAGAMGFYFWRVTGNPLKMPFLVNRETYAMAPHFIWQSPSQEPWYHHKAMRDFYLTELSGSDFSRSKGGTLGKIQGLWNFYVGPVLTLPLLLVPWTFKDRRIRLLFAIGAVIVTGLILSVWIMPHYVAPATSLIFAVIVQSMRHLRLFKLRGKETGLFLVRAILLLFAVMLIIRAIAIPLHIPLGRVPFGWNPWRLGYGPAISDRTRVLAKLKEHGGRHLVIVRHKEDQRWHNEWVYNEADIDHAEVVWAREMDSTSNEALLKYFKDRHVWLGEPDRSPYRTSASSSDGGPPVHKVRISNKERPIFTRKEDEP